MAASHNVSQGPARASPPAVLGQLRIVCNSENMVMINTQLHIDMVFFGLPNHLPNEGLYLL